ncbi:MAG: hypothetical protein RL498_389 [Pseudomonadota bacterium]|jgi:hypothetical protein
MPCELCRNNMARTYSHSRTPTHKKMLFAKLLEKKKKAIEKYGYFKWVDP